MWMLLPEGAEKGPTPNPAWAATKLLYVTNAGRPANHDVVGLHGTFLIGAIVRPRGASGKSVSAMVARVPRRKLQ